MRYRNIRGSDLPMILVASVTLAFGSVSATLAQDPSEEAQSWRDEIGPNDQRVTGIIGEVREETFELQSHGTLYHFEIPSDPEQKADVRTGNEVQVWYDPAGYQRDGDAYYRASVVAPSDESIGAPLDSQPASTASGTSTNPSMNRDSNDQAETPFDSQNDDQAQVEYQAENEAAPSEAPASVSAESEFSAETEQQEQSQLAQTEQSQGRYRDEQIETAAQENDDSARVDDQRMDDEQTLPQTAGALPLVALTGLCGLFGAVALRIFRS